MKQPAFILIHLIMTSLLIVGCSDDDFTDADSFLNQQDIDEEIITNYILENDISADRTSSGLYKQDLDDSLTTSREVNNSDVVQICYEMFLLDGTSIIGNDSYIFSPSIGSFMLGLNEGVLLMKEGEKANLILPSHLAFGGSELTINEVNVPANSVILLTVHVTAVRTEAEQAEYEDSLLQAYLTSKGLTGTRTSSGLYHIILEEGDSTSGYPSSNNSVTVAYKGSLLDDTEFDSNDNATFNLSQLITGFTEGVTLMHRDERALVLMPSQLAYGSRGNQVNIGPYTPLIFEITLINF